MSSSPTHFILDRRSQSYWRVTFDHPPINTITATTVSELSDLVALIERDTRVNVIVFDSSNPDFFLAHYDVENDPSKTGALGAGLAVVRRTIDTAALVSRHIRCCSSAQLAIPIVSELMS